jgi:DNA-binding NarL/FixJ family response regulator
LEVDQATLVLVPEGASPALAAELAARGASLVSDGVSREQLVIALKATASGLVVRDLASMPAQPVQAQLAPGETESLTEREHEILRLVGEGMVNRDIARALGLSDHTVKFHLHSIFRKLGARSRTEAVSLAIRRGLLML